MLQVRQPNSPHRFLHSRAAERDGEEGALFVLDLPRAQCVMPEILRELYSRKLSIVHLDAAVAGERVLYRLRIGNLDGSALDAVRRQEAGEQLRTAIVRTLRCHPEHSPRRVHTSAPFPLLHAFESANASA